MLLSQIQRKVRTAESSWHVIVAILVAIGLELVLNDKLSFGTKYIVAGLEFILLILLTVFPISPRIKRPFAITLLAIISAANLASLYVVLSALFGSVQVNGHDLLVSSLAIYLTNIIVFGLWYWELDNTREAVPDFLFAQQSVDLATKWRATFFDYLYISVTNATAFSPTDSLPLTHRAKFLMLAQSLISLVTIALVVSRAVNILG